VEYHRTPQRANQIKGVDILMTSAAPSFTILDDLERAQRTSGPAAAIDRLIDSLRTEKEYRRLFDALLLKRRFEMGLPLTQPASLDVPAERRDEFEKAFVDAAREVGELFLANGQIPQAWSFLNMIREPQRVAEAIERLDANLEPGEQTESVIAVALYEGANPVKGLEILLRTHGTCNTITAVDQHMQRLKPEEQRRAAALLVRQLYDELTASVRRDIERRQGAAPAAGSLRELLSDRDWLFEGGNYHIDVSHLHSVVRFARVFAPGHPELDKARQLAEYGARLDPQFQYAADPPFDEYYAAHIEFFRVLAGDNRDHALQYFRAKLAAEPDERDRPYLAVVLVDLLCRIDRLDEAVDVAEEHLKQLDDSSGFSFGQLCEEAGRLDALARVAREKGDAVTYLAALIQGGNAE
jgi:hypothetical protein